MSNALESGSARRTRRRARTANAVQLQKEQARLAEAESDVATGRAKALGGQGGRRSLIKSSPGGLSTNLGGTAA